MKKLAIAITAMLGASACASDRIDFGGVANPVALTGQVVDCETAGVVMTERAPVTFPNSLLSRAYYAQVRDGFHVEVPFTFDVSRAGDVVNVRFSGDPEMTRDSAERDAILFGADSLMASEFEWQSNSRAQYATGCTDVVTFGSRLIGEP